MSARKIPAAVCTALALTLASTSPALAYSNGSAPHSQYEDPTCTIRGTNGDDGTSANPLKGTNGPDVICGFGGNDIIDGMDGDDRIEGGPGNDTIYGGDGTDTIEGQGGMDTIFGGPGADNIRGDTSDDRIYANDTANTNDNATDTINGGGGNDPCSYTVPPAAFPDTVTNCEVINP